LKLKIFFFFSELLEIFVKRTKNSCYGLFFFQLFKWMICCFLRFKNSQEMKFKVLRRDGWIMTDFQKYCSSGCLFFFFVVEWVSTQISSICRSVRRKQLKSFALCSAEHLLMKIVFQFQVILCFEEINNDSFNNNTEESIVPWRERIEIY